MSLLQTRPFHSPDLQLLSLLSSAGGGECLWASGMCRHATEVHHEVAEKCVKATCVLHNFLWKTTQASVVRGTSRLNRWNHCQVWEDLLPTSQQERLSGLGRPSHPYSRLRELSHGRTQCKSHTLLLSKLPAV